VGSSGMCTVGSAHVRAPQFEGREGFYVLLLPHYHFMIGSEVRLGELPHASHWLACLLIVTPKVGDLARTWPDLRGAQRGE
jgi:hypothetical protein